MARDDHAIVVGISRYPGLGDLAGPENDAGEFTRWLLSPTGGDVPCEHVRTIVSSDYPAPPDPHTAEPTVAAVQECLDALLVRSEVNQENGVGHRVGRRLYLYFAGHGFEPEPEQVVLLAANAARRRGYHVAGVAYADYFRRCGIFSEVLLFMDCCRQSMYQIPLSAPSLAPMMDTDAPECAKWFMAFATKWSRTSREKPLDGRSRGIFTAALLRGLSGDAADPDGRITDESLAGFLYLHMKDVLTPEELEDPDIPKLPDIHYDRDPHNRILISNVAPPEYGVELRASADVIGQQLTIRDGAFKVVFSDRVAGAPIVARLPRGLYLAQILPGGQEAPFSLPGAEAGGPVHVDL